MNKVKEALLNRKLTVGSWIQTGSPVSAEILSRAGFDFIGIDMEHSDIHVNEFASIARGMDAFGTLAFARVRENDTLAIRQVLDMGAQGIIVPMVDNAEDAKRAVQAAKYPPIGVRGFGYARANNWGVDFDEYAKKANDDIPVVVMIESKAAVDNIDEILDVDGVDGVFIGPYDMSGSYGLVGQPNHPVVIDACNRVAEACARHHKSAGRHIVIVTEEDVKRALEQGFTFLVLGTDINFLSNGAKACIDMVK